MNRLNEHYETLGEFIAAAERAPLNSEKASRSTSSTSTEWTGTSSFEEAVKLARHGWPEGRRKLVSALAQAQAAPRVSPAMVMDVAGAYPVAALAAAGDPCSMVDLSPVEDRVRPIVRLVIQRGGSSAYSASEFTNYGAAVLSYVEGLEAAGFRCEIVASFAADLRELHHMLSVTVKRAEEPIEMDRMAYVLTHASFFRRIAFAVKESTPGVHEALGSSYGHSRSPEAGVETDPDQIIVPGVNMAPPGSAALKSAKAALEMFGPMIEVQLQNKGLQPPPLAFGGGNK